MRTLLLILLSLPLLSFAEMSQYERVKYSCIDDKYWESKTCRFSTEQEGYTDGGGPIGFLASNAVSGMAEIMQFGYELTYSPAGLLLPTPGTIKRDPDHRCFSRLFEET